MKEYKYVQHVSDYQTKQYLEEYERKYIKKGQVISPYDFISFIESEEEKKAKQKETELKRKKDKQEKTANFYNLAETCNLVQTMVDECCLKKFSLNNIKYKGKIYKIIKRHEFKKSDDNDFTFPWHSETSVDRLTLCCDDGRKMIINKVHRVSTDANSSYYEEPDVNNYIEVKWDDCYFWYSLGYAEIYRNNQLHYELAKEFLETNNTNIKPNFSKSELRFLNKVMFEFLSIKNKERSARFEAQQKKYNSPNEVAKRLVKNLTDEQKAAVKKLLNK